VRVSSLKFVDKISVLSRTQINSYKVIPQSIASIEGQTRLFSGNGRFVGSYSLKNGRILNAKHLRTGNYIAVSGHAIRRLFVQEKSK
jgi:hypothetical protein